MIDHPYTPGVVLPEPFTVREGDVGDVGDLVAVELLSQGAPWTHRVFEKEFDLEFSHTWVVEWHDAGAPCKLAAYLVFWLVHDEIHVLNVVVHPDARRRGLAVAMLNDLIDIAERNAVALLSLEVRVGNAPAQSLYRALGFVPIGRRANYYADNHEDADVLALLLNG